MRSKTVLAGLLCRAALCAGALLAATPDAATVAAGRVSSARALSPVMLAKKPFKGGRLDDFISAGEAEAKYGPNRYAAVAEDAWKIRMERDRIEQMRQLSAREYAAQKSQMLQDHLFLSAISCVVMSACFDEKATFSCAVGAALGALYLYLLQRNVDGVGASTVEEVSKLPPPIVVPVVLVLLVAKNTATLALIPTLAGFLISKLATLTQLAYPDGWGVAETE